MEQIASQYVVKDKDNVLKEGTTPKEGGVRIKYLESNIEGRDEDGDPVVDISFSKPGYFSETKEYLLTVDSGSPVPTFMNPITYSSRHTVLEKGSRPIQNAKVENYLVVDGDTAIIDECFTNSRGACRINKFSVDDDDALLPGETMYFRASKSGYNAQTQSATLDKDNRTIDVDFIF
jgi:hypothetical protein